MSRTWSYKIGGFCRSCESSRSLTLGAVSVSPGNETVGKGLKPVGASSLFLMCGSLDQDGHLAHRKTCHCLASAKQNVNQEINFPGYQD